MPNSTLLRWQPVWPPRDEARVCCIFHISSERYDQLVHDVCRQNLHVVFAIDRAGLVGADGETHQGVFDIAYLRHLPNMTILMPKDENELQHMLYTAVYHDGPIAVRYPRGNGYGIEMDSELKKIDIGKWEVVRDGKELTILSFGTMLLLQKKRQLFLQRKILMCVLLMHVPLNRLMPDILQELYEEKGAVLTLEEAALQGSFGSAVLEHYHDLNPA